jgi:hypothetical protein
LFESAIEQGAPDPGFTPAKAAVPYVERLQWFKALARPL